MRIFVTGATGFIGSHFVERAIGAGHSIVALYRPGNRDSGALQLLRDRGAHLIAGDILQPESFAQALVDVACCCHFASAFREMGVADDYFDSINVKGARRVLETAAANGVRRFVYCSTAGIYGQQVDGLIDERRTPQPWNAYERSKLAAEKAVREGARAIGIEYVILRPSSVYGPRDQRLHKLFHAVARGRFPLFGSGAGRRHMIYVADLVDAFLLACESPAAANEEFIVAGPRAAPLKETLEILARAAGRTTFGPRLPLKPMLMLSGVVEDVCRKLNVKPPLHRRRMDFYLNNAEFDCSRAHSKLAWRPRVDLHDGFTATLASLAAREVEPG